MPSPISAPGRAAARGGDAQHQLGLLERPARLGRPAAVGRQPDLGVAAQPRRGPARRVGRPGQQRVDLVLHRLGQRAGDLRGQRRDQPARAAPVRVGAQRHEASPQVAAKAGGPPLHVGRVELGPRQQLLEERAAQRLLGLVPGLDDGDLGERRDRRHVQVLAGVRPPRAQQQHRARARARPTRSAPRPSRRRALWAPAGQAGAHVALVACPAFEGNPQSRHDHGHRRTGVSGGDLRHALQPVAGQHGAHHLQVGAARASGRASRVPATTS